MEETIKQDKDKSHKEFEKLLSQDLSTRKFKEGTYTIFVLYNESNKKQNRPRMIFSAEKCRPKNHASNIFQHMKTFNYTNKKLFGVRKYVFSVA